MKKLIAGLTTTALIASLSAPAFAANFGDVKGTTYEKSTALLKALKVVNGDVDGKFNPNNELTRAEFAKIAVQLSGLGAAADATGVHASPFADVQDGDWFAGYVQVAKDAGLVNGVGYGMFAPNDKVRYEEVLAVVERILGYSDKLQGNWPTKYVIKGTELKLYSGTAFGVGKNITRGDVALIVNAALNTPVVTYSTDLNQFVNTQDPNAGVGSTFRLISKNFGTSVSSAATLTDVSTLAGTGLLDGQIKVGTAAPLKLSSDVTVVGGATAADLVGHTVKYVTDGDGNVAYLAEATASTKLVTGTADVDSTPTTVRVNGTNYTFETSTVAPAAPAQTYKNYSAATASSTTTISAGDTVTLILNDAGNVQYAVANHVESPVIAGDIYAATSVTKASISLTSSAYTIESNTMFTLNGNAATLADIKKGDVLYATIGSAGGVSKVLKVDAYRNVVTVKADSYALNSAGNLKSVTAGSTTYSVDSSFTIGNTVAVGSSYVLTLTKDGTVAKVTAVVPTTNDMLVLSVGTGNYLKDNQVTPGTMITFLDKAGNKVVKFVAKNTGGTDVVASAASTSTSIDAGNVGTFTLDSNGFINGWTEETILAENNQLVKQDGVDATAKSFVMDTTNNKYYVSDTTLFYDIHTGVVNAKAVAFSNLTGGTGKLVTVIVDPNDQSKALAVLMNYDTGVSSKLSQQAGVYVTRKTVTTADGSTDYVTLNVNGVNTDYKVDSLSAMGTDFTTPVPAIAAGDLVKLTDGDFARAVNGVYDSVYKGTVASAVYRNTNVANAVYLDTVGGTTVVTDSNTKVYVVKYVGSDYTLNRDSAVVGSINDFNTLTGQAGSTKFKFEVVTKSDKIGGYNVADAIVVYLQK